MGWKEREDLTFFYTSRKINLQSMPQKTLYFFFYLCFVLAWGWRLCLYVNLTFGRRNALCCNKICFNVLSSFGLQPKTKIVETIRKFSPIIEL